MFTISANETIHSVGLHLDYLTQENVIFALFDPTLSDQEKNIMAQTLISTNRHVSFEIGKPKPPVIEWRLDDSPALSDFVEERS